METQRRALISVSDKTNVVSFATKLVALGYEIVSTGGTYHLLSDHHVPVKKVSDITGFPEIMDGRVKTLHPLIHGGILARRDNPQDMAVAQKQGIVPIDFVVVNLYPFLETVARPDATHEEILENIDIGGPTMVRAAAKNYQSVTILVDYHDYDRVIQILENDGEITEVVRQELARKAFQHTALYDASIARFFSEFTQEKIPSQLSIAAPLNTELRYGENPHQKAGFYTKKNLITVLHGKQLSFNNFQDIHAALHLIRKFTDQPTVAILKHCNPCGVAEGESLAEAYTKAFATDQQSPYGGIVIANEPIDIDAATAINKIFTEIIIAPSFTVESLALLRKKKNRRLVTFDLHELHELTYEKNIRSCLNGMLVQNWDAQCDDNESWTVVTKRSPTTEEYKRMTFAWKVVSQLTSNAIAICDQDRTIGLGMGQPSRIDSTELALMRAKKYQLSADHCALASDAFFPFRDTIDRIAKEGITAVIQPGGSVRDQEVIDACNEQGITMIFTGMRHFKH